MNDSTCRWCKKEIVWWHFDGYAPEAFVLANGEGGEACDVSPFGYHDAQHPSEVARSNKVQCFYCVDMTFNLNGCCDRHQEDETVTLHSVAMHSHTRAVVR